MARKSTIDETKLIGFGKWLIPRIQRKGWTVNRVAEQVGIDPGQLGKIIKAYDPQYSSYTRPGYEYTVAIGKLFGDVRGALESADYEVLPEHQEITYSLSPQALRIAERYDHADSAIQRAAKGLFGTYEDDDEELTDAEKAVEELNRAGAHGRRPNN